MKTRSFMLAVLLLLVVALASPSAEGGPYDKVVCPITDGQFILEQGQLWFRIFRHGGKPVKKRTEKVANPLDEKANEALAKRGRVPVAAHPDESGGLFIHWDSLK